MTTNRQQANCFSIDQELLKINALDHHQNMYVYAARKHDIANDYECISSRHDNIVS